MKKKIIFLVLIFKILICSAQIDVGVISIKSPGLFVPIDSHFVNVEVVIKNFGTIPVTTIPVIFSQNNLPPIWDTLTGYLLPEDTLHYSFSNRIFFPWGSAYFICAYTNLTNDNNIHNDTTCKIVWITLTSGNENEKNKFKVYPTPSVNLVNFQLYSDENCSFKIRIFNSIGTEIDNFYYPIKNGNNIIEYKTNHLPKGIYFYSLESLKNNYSGKFIINRQ